VGSLNQGYNLGGGEIVQRSVSLPDIPGLDPNAEYFDIVDNIKEEPRIREEPESDCNLEEFEKESVDDFFETV